LFRLGWCDQLNFQTVDESYFRSLILTRPLIKLFQELRHSGAAVGFFRAFWTLAVLPTIFSPALLYIYYAGLESGRPVRLRKKNNQKPDIHRGPSRG